MTAKHQIVKISLAKALVEQIEDEVASEHLLKLYVNDYLKTVFSCSPCSIVELIVGHLLTRHVINATSEIKDLRIDRGKAYIQTCLNPESRLPDAETGNDKEESLSLSVDVVVKAARVLDEQAAVFRRTGGTHAAALLGCDGAVLAFSEDIGRHNAVDKVVGKAALDGVCFRKTLLSTTGRLPFEIVLKAANVRVPIVVSVAPPTNKGIEIAEKKGITLIGFARGERFNIYAHPERLRYNNLKRSF
jgi:FdhD protein